MRSRILAETGPNDLLSMVSFYGELRWSNFDGTYSDDEVEEHVTSRVLKDRRFRSPAVKSGVVRNWLTSFGEEGGHKLLVTRWLAKRFKNFLDANGIVYRLCCAHGVWLVNEIVGYCASAARVILHIHPDDIASLVAAIILARAGKEVIFYNHADHVFSFGNSSANVVAEVSTYGIALNRRTGRAKKSCYLGILIDAMPRASGLLAGGRDGISSGVDRAIKWETSWYDLSGPAR